MPERILLEKKTDLQVIGKVLKLLAAGGTFIYPTDTVYGLGCDATNPTAVTKIYSIKDRQKSRPLSVMVDRLETIYPWVEILSDTARDLTKNFLPGALTLVMKTKTGMDSLLIAGQNSLGVRIPDHPFCLEICRRWGKPIVTTSANHSGNRSVVNIDSLDEAIKNQVDLIVDGGEIKSVGESTVIDISTIPPRILRKGSVEPNAIRRFIPNLV